MKRRIRIKRRDGIRQRYWVGKTMRKNYGMAWSIQPGQYVEYMPPKEFIAKTGFYQEEYPKYLQQYSDFKTDKREPISKLSKKIISKTPKVNIPWIDDPSPLMVGHEGRHRAYAAELAGEKIIPVAMPLPREKREELAEEFIKESFPDSSDSYKREWRGRFERGHPEHSMDNIRAKIFDRILQKHNLKFNIK